MGKSVSLLLSEKFDFLKRECSCDCITSCFSVLSMWSAMKKKPLCSVVNSHGKDQTTSVPNWIVSVATLLNTDLAASGTT